MDPKPRRLHFTELPVGARLYLVGVVGAGSAVLAWRLSALPISFSSEVLALLGLAIVLGPRTVQLGMRVEMSGALPLIFTALMASGVAAAIDVSVVSMLATCLLRRHPFESHRTAFNVTSIVLTTFVGGQVYLHLNTDPAEIVASNYIFPLLASVLTYYFMNTMMVATAVGLSRKVSIPALWRDSFLWTSVSYFAGGSMAVGLVMLVEAYGLYAMLAVIPPVLLILYSYQLHLESMDERRKRIEIVEQINVDLERMVAQRTHELQEVNRRLKESNQELQRASQLKSEFLANVSHELRTPLNAIIGFSELLQEGSYGPINDEQREFVADINDSGKHLLSLINDILDLSKIEAGRMTLNREEFNLSSLVRECLTVIRPLALKKNLTLSWDLDEAPALAWADSGMIKQILYNLLANAVKFTPEGGQIELLCRSVGRDLVVSVSDTGIGIPREAQERVFSEFYQVDGSYSRRYQGTGLGLALVKRFAEMHGGEVSVKSTPDEGSTFTFRIPDAIQSTEAATSIRKEISASTQPARPVDGERGVVLVVEDNPVNMRLTRSLLVSSGFQVLEARDSGEAIQQLSRQQPDLILMDVQLPGMDGLELTRRLKKDPKTAEIPTIALTAHAMKGDEERAIEAGCSGYIPKPIDPSRFAEQISSYMRVPVD
jgi:signal transduction histidine kinase/CheY-like chemotaxis protein